MKRNFLKTLTVFFAVFGPSVITTMAGNDGGGVITYSLSGATLGYTVLLTIPALTLLYAVTQEMGSRIAIVTGKGLGDLIRERWGVRISLIVFALLLIANFGSVLANVTSLKTASIMLGIPPLPFLAATMGAAFLIVTRANYQRNQKIFLTGIVLYFSYVFSAIKGNPDWPLALKSLVVPTGPLLTRDFILTSIAVLGTTITPWGQFFVQSYMKDKNVPVERLPYAKLEAYVGAFVSNFFTFFIIVATAATLYAHRIPLSSGEQAAMAIRPFAGEFSGILFAVGLVNAAVIGMIIISLSSAYAFSEFFGFEGTLDAPYERSRSFYMFFLLSLLCAGVVTLFPFVSVFRIVLYTQSLNAILLPMVFYFLLKIANSKSIMEQYVNSWWHNVVGIGASAIIIIAAALGVFISFAAL